RPRDPIASAEIRTQKYAVPALRRDCCRSPDILRLDQKPTTCQALLATLETAFCFVWSPESQIWLRPVDSSRHRMSSDSSPSKSPTPTTALALLPTLASTVWVVLLPER